MGGGWRHVRSEHFVFCLLHAWFLTASNEDRQFLLRAEAAQRLQSRSRVCGRRVATDSGRDASLSILRAAELGSPNGRPRHGHRFSDRRGLFVAFEMTPEGIKLERDIDRRVTHKTGRKLTALITVVAALAAGVTVFRFLHSERGTAQERQPSVATEIESKSIAVLPFENLSEEKENA